SVLVGWGVMVVLSARSSAPDRVVAVVSALAVVFVMVVVGMVGVVSVGAPAPVLPVPGAPGGSPLHPSPAATSRPSTHGPAVAAALGRAPLIAPPSAPAGAR